MLGEVNSVSDNITFRDIRYINKLIFIKNNKKSLYRGEK